MPDKCYHCRRQPAEKYGVVEFEYHGVKLQTIRTGGWCSKCAKKQSKEQFDKVPVGVITPVPGELPKIDWRKYLEISTGDRDYHGGPRDQTTRIFVELGILVYPEATEECWIVLGCNMNLGPNPGLSPLGFAREDDARMYAKLKYAKAMYPVYIYRQGKMELVNRKS